MKTATVTWTLPTTRESGGVLDILDILEVEVFLSADAGANFSLLGSVAPTVPQELVVQNLDFGDYIFRAVVIDSISQRSNDADLAVVILDDSPPSAIADLAVTIS